ncbi:hypothetical protein FTUN_5476 [Frigoriglobus tundricola]|uniref:Uncharacterized protein n=1 Tax=Frigoriglobus tundricola TaxID=2774151 RepID=A0A6M5YWX8_9BACT|nr:hypothetical protein FTUN_5476 [Frigoriglobus tundricola]
MCPCAGTVILGAPTETGTDVARPGASLSTTGIRRAAGGLAGN